MKLFIVSCIVCVGFAVSDSSSTPVFVDPLIMDYYQELSENVISERYYASSPSYDPMKNAYDKYNQALQDFLTEKNILQLLQIFASSHPDAFYILEKMQYVSNEGYDCVFENLEPHASDISDGYLSIVDFIFELAKGQCQQYQFNLMRLTYALNNANTVEIVRGLSLSQYVPVRIVQRFEEFFIALAQFVQNGFLDDGKKRIDDTHANLTFYVSQAGKATTASLVEAMPFLEDLALPGRTYYLAYSMYVLHGLWQSMENEHFNQTEFSNAREILKLYEIDALPDMLAWLQEKINNAEIAPNAAFAKSLNQLARRIKPELKNVYFKPNIF